MATSELEQGQEAPEQQLQEGQAEGAGQETEQAAEQPDVNLDELPQFRRWKSKMDRRLAQERQERERLQEKLEAHQQEVDELRLQDADPQEREKYLRNKIAQLQEEQRMQAERQKRVAEMTQKADRFLEKLGLSRDNPGLDWSGDPMEDGFEKLALSAVEIASRQEDKSKQEVETEVRKAKQEAMKETGAADVSTATGGGGPGLRAQYEKDLAKLRGTRDIRGLIALRNEYREKGLDV